MSRETTIPFLPHVAIIATCIKLLMLKSYKSTDFDVHRNWLSITYSRPVSQWYTESTNQWTMDYPPLFAYFQYLMSLIAVRFDEKMVHVTSDDYRSPETIVFQCLTVIVSDFVFYFAVYVVLRFVSSSDSPSSLLFRSKITFYKTRCQALGEEDEETSHWFDARLLVTMLLIFSPGLLIVDHMHFQYNGLLIGIFLLSIMCMMEDRFLAASILFSILIHMKHIFLYVAPAFFVLILRRHCFDRHLNFRVKNFVLVSLCVTGVTAASLGPFVAQLLQLKDRLFPFKRGLTHAYWAPNLWSMYNTMDWLLAKLVFGVTGTPAYVTGVVQDFDHLLLPSMRPAVTFLLTLGLMSPALVVLWRRSCFCPDPQTLFLRIVILCSLSSFLVSWHVHEKAILMSIIPLTVLTLVSHSDAQSFVLMSAAGTHSLFPLLTQSADTSVKLLLTLAYFAYAVPGLAFYWKRLRVYEEETSFLTTWQKVYLTGFVVVQLVSSVLSMDGRLAFAPLALTSLYAVPGIVVPFLRIYRQILVT